MNQAPCVDLVQQLPDDSCSSRATDLEGGRKNDSRDGENDVNVAPAASHSSYRSSGTQRSEKHQHDEAEIEMGDTGSMRGKKMSRKHAAKLLKDSNKE